MFNRPPATQNEALDRLYAKYDDGIRTGELLPFVYPWCTLGPSLCLLYLLIPHHNSRFLQRLRFPVWAFNAYFSIYTIFYCRARNSACAFGVGLVSVWSLLWTGTLLVVHDAQTDFQRIERTEGACASLQLVQNRAPGEEKGTRPVKTIKDADLSAERRTLGTTSGPAQRKGTFAWQHYPLSPFIERLDWVADVFCNFRGMGWNWRISGLAPPPLWVQKQLHENSGTSVSDKDINVGADGTHRYHTRAEVLRAAWKTFVTSYLMLDVLKVIVILDPYFWGQIDAPAPSFLPALIRSSPVFTRVFRLLVSLYAIKTALITIFSLAPLFFVGMLGSKIIGARAEPWMYPDTYGSFKLVLNKGLAGWWGGWWHQTFRYAFEAPSKRLITAFNLDPRSLPARALQLFIAFALSGSLHAAGSLTQSGTTYPLSGPFSFFVLQAFGIVVQTLLVSFLGRIGLVQTSPKLVRQLGNFVYVHVWFYYTAPLLCDDFSRGGIWLFEPVPISPVRALGIGDRDSSWWCWRMRDGSDWFRWHRGRYWWESGIAL